MGQASTVIRPEGAVTLKWPEEAETVLRRDNDEEEEEEEAQDGLAAQRLKKLEAWYQNCQIAHDMEDTLEDEVLDNNQIAMDIMALVPGYEKDLKDGYCQACRKFQDSWSQEPDDCGSLRQMLHMNTIKELLAASQAGCRLCILFRQNLNRNRCLKIEQRLEFLGKPSTLFLRATGQVRGGSINLSYCKPNPSDLVVASLRVFSIGKLG